MQELTSVLLATLNPSPVVRQAAELGLADGSSKPGARRPPERARGAPPSALHVPYTHLPTLLPPGFGLALAKLALSKDAHIGIKQLAAVTLKNFIKARWGLPSHRAQRTGSKAVLSPAAETLHAACELRKPCSRVCGNCSLLLKLSAFRSSTQSIHKADAPAPRPTPPLSRSTGRRARSATARPPSATRRKR